MLPSALTRILRVTGLRESISSTALSKTALRVPVVIWSIRCAVVTIRCPNGIPCTWGVNTDVDAGFGAVTGRWGTSMQGGVQGIWHACCNVRENQKR